MVQRHPVLVRCGTLIYSRFDKHVVEWRDPGLVLLDYQEPNACHAVDIHDQEEHELGQFKVLHQLVDL